LQLLGYLGSRALDFALLFGRKLVFRNLAVMVRVERIEAIVEGLCEIGSRNWFCRNTRLAKCRRNKDQDQQGWDEHQASVHGRPPEGCLSLSRLLGATSDKLGGSGQTAS
jgi:hypothetical protein